MTWSAHYLIEIYQGLQVNDLETFEAAENQHKILTHTIFEQLTLVQLYRLDFAWLFSPFELLEAEIDLNLNVSWVVGLGIEFIEQMADIVHWRSIGSGNMHGKVMVLRFLLCVEKGGVDPPQPIPNFIAFLNDTDHPHIF